MHTLLLLCSQDKEGYAFSTRSLTVFSDPRLSAWQGTKTEAQCA